MKKFILIVFILFFIVGCRNTDSILFKKEYESLNSNSNYYKVEINSSNPFVYISEDDLIKKIENKEEIVVLLGYSKSNETRSIISNIIKACDELNVDKIYYLDILDIRDSKDINENGEIITTKEGSNSYNKLLELIDEQVEDYIVKNQIVGKRIYAPSILIIHNKDIELVKVKSYLEDALEKDKEIYNIIYEKLENYSNKTCEIDEGC